MRSDTLKILKALHSHLGKKGSISGPELVETSHLEHTDSATRVLRKLVTLRILRASGYGNTRTWSWADPGFARLTADGLAAEYERRDAAAKGKPLPPNRPAAKPAAVKKPAAPPKPQAPLPDWIAERVEYNKRRKPGDPPYNPL